MLGLDFGLGSKSTVKEELVVPKSQVSPFWKYFAIFLLFVLIALGITFGVLYFLGWITFEKPEAPDS
jgi:hypothetical protein